jgi:Pyridoxamine 5'-phosphate oxidase
VSISVDLHELQDVVAGQAPFAYLLTVSTDGRPHAVAVTTRVDDAEVVCDAGSTSCANATARPDVSFLWPPATAGDYSLIVDGRAHVDGSAVRVTPSRAVRHRPAPGGGNDCQQISLE